eukprot:364379-Chlamydomonas_euryale.AAC.4
MGQAITTGQLSLGNIQTALQHACSLCRAAPYQRIGACAAGLWTVALQSTSSAHRGQEAPASRNKGASRMQAATVTSRERHGRQRQQLWRALSREQPIEAASVLGTASQG